MSEDGFVFETAYEDVTAGEAVSEAEAGLEDEAVSELEVGFAAEPVFEVGAVRPTAF